MSRTCRNCGAQLADTDKVCPNCGSPVIEEIEASEDTVEMPAIKQEPVDQQAETQPQEEQEEKLYVVEKHSIISNIFYTLLVLVLLLCLAFGYCYFKHPDYIDTAFSYIGVKTNFARNIEITGTYNSTQAKVTPTPSASTSVQ